MARGAAARDEGLIAAATLTNPALFEFWEKVFFGENDSAVLHGSRSSSKTRDTACQLVRLNGFRRFRSIRLRMRLHPWSRSRPN